VTDFNRFGNVQLNVRRSDVENAGLDGVNDVAVHAISASVGGEARRHVADFAAGEYGIHFDPRGWPTLARPRRANGGQRCAGGSPAERSATTRVLPPRMQA
jgi:hypothetical protein